MSAGDPASWAPNEPASSLLGERTLLAGIMISGVAYGINVTLFFITLNLLWKRPRREDRKGFLWIAYVCFMFALCSVGNGAQLKGAEMVFINYRNYPGGPAIYYLTGRQPDIGVACNSIYIVSTWFQDGLLLYRFSIICGRSWYKLAFPGLLFLTTIGLGCTMMGILATRGATVNSAVVYPVFTSYFSVSIAFNIILTCAIVARLLLARRMLGSAAAAAAGPYVSVSAMLIESAFLYSATGIAYLTVYGLNSPGSGLILPVLAQLQTVAPLLIIMRVAQGQAWSRETAAGIATSSMHFDGSMRTRRKNSLELTTMDAARATETKLAPSEIANGSDILAEKPVAV